MLYTLFFLPISIAALCFFLFTKKITFVNFYQKLGFIPLKNAAKKEFVHVHLCSIGEWNTFFTFLSDFKKEIQNPVLVTYFNQDLSKVINKSRLVEKCFFLPLENPLSIYSLLIVYRIKYSVISEAESWPGLLFAMRILRKKAFLVNAALFTKEFKHYQTLKFFFKPLFNSYYAIYPTSKEFLNRFLALGVEKKKLILGGNFKFDVNYVRLAKKLPLRATKKKIIILSSVHFAEFKAMFNALRDFLTNEEYVFLIAPRSLLEKGEWLKFLRKNHIDFKKRSEMQTIDFETHVFLDSYGELYSFYQKAFLVIMGGSFIPIGGHNILEPISENKAILIGPYTHHFDDIITIFRKELFFSSTDNLQQDLYKLINKLPMDMEGVYKNKLQKNRGRSKEVLHSILKSTSQL